MERNVIVQNNLNKKYNFILIIKKIMLNNKNIKNCKSKKK